MLGFRLERGHKNKLKRVESLKLICNHFSKKRNVFCDFDLAKAEVSFCVSVVRHCLRFGEFSLFQKAELFKWKLPPARSKVYEGNKD